MHTRTLTSQILPCDALHSPLTPLFSLLPSTFIPKLKHHTSHTHPTPSSLLSLPCLLPCPSSGLAPPLILHALTHVLHQQCTDTLGQDPPFVCAACPPGYAGDGRACADIDECVEATPCAAVATCANEEGAYACAPCPAGYAGNGTRGSGLTDAAVRQTCADIDECLTDNGGCDPHAPCVNTIGSVECGACPSQYSGSGETRCRPLPICPLVDCGVDSTCLGVAFGSFECVLYP